MPKAKLLFFCQNCGFESTKWMGQCPGCKEWNTFAEEPQAAVPKKTAAGSVRKDAPHPKTLSEIEVSQTARMTTGMGELDRVLGGGAVKGSLVLVGGAPGIGKSTLMLQICQQLGRTCKVLYVSGEESARQLKLRARRLSVDSENLFVLSETRLGDVLAKEHYLTLEKTASDCLQCGHCNSRCPFSVDQMARMEEIQKYFGR